MKSPFEEKFFTVLAAELRRQGVTQSRVQEVLPRITERTRVNTIPPSTTTRPSSDDDSSGSSAAALAGQPLRVLELNLNHSEVGDRAVMAVCEVLLKYNNVAATAAGLRAADNLHERDVDTWHVLLQKNNLSDRAVRHLGLLVESCPKLSLLDVSQNHFSEEGTEKLRHAAAASPHDCEVVLDVVGDSHRERPKEVKDGRPSPLSPLPPPPPPPTLGSAMECVTVTVRSRSSSSSLLLDSRQLRQRSSQAATTAREEGEGGEGGDGGGVGDRPSLREACRDKEPDLSPSPLAQGALLPHQANAPPHYADRAVRSPSTATATSATSRSHFASGSAEALRKRRQELFSQTSAGSGSVRAPPVPPTEGSGPKGDDKETVPPPKEPSQQLRPDTPEREVHVTSSPFPDRGSARKRRSPSAAASSHEPFDQNPQLDLTANLNPVLDSVLDLSAIADETGSGLKQPAAFGGAQSVWEILEAYERAADVKAKAQRGSRSSESGVLGISEEMLAKLPSALTGGGVYKALTVLNLSGNHLKAITVLPASLLRLDVSDNALTSLHGVHQSRMLTVLNARRNELEVIAGLENNLCLAHLFLGRNRVALVEGMAHLLLLETLDLTYNQLPNPDSIRALSLCRSLRHLLIKGNPFALSLKAQNYKPLIRSLCPTLVMLDDTKLSSSSRYMDAAQLGSRQPTVADARQQQRPASHKETLLSFVALPGNAQNPQSRLNAPFGSALVADRSSVAGRSSVSDENAELVEQSMNSLYLLTRGVTVPMGYGDAGYAAKTVRDVANREAVKREEAEKRRIRESTANGKSMRVEMVKKLAVASKKYLEAAIVDQMTSLQQQQQQQQEQQQQPPESVGVAQRATPPPQQRAGPSGDDNPAVAGTAGYARILEESVLEKNRAAKTEADILRAYEMRPFKAPPAWKGKHRSAGNSRGRASVSTASTSPDGRRSASTVAPDQRGRRSVSARRNPNPVADSGDTTVEEVLVFDGHESGRAGSPAQRPSSSFAHAAAGHAARRLHSSSYFRDVDGVVCSPIRCFDDSGLMHSFDEGESGKHGRECDALHQPPQLLPSHHGPAAAAAPAAAAGVAAARSGQAPTHRPAASSFVSKHRKTVVRREEGNWQPHTQRAGEPPHRQRERPQSSSQHLGRSNPVSRSVPGSMSARTSYKPPQPSDPVCIDDAQRRRVRSWTAQFRADTEAVQAALTTVVQLLEAQRGRTLEVPESSAELPQTYLQERRKCVAIIQDSGMLHDTQVPVDVVIYYGFGRQELESGAAATPAAAARGPESSRGMSEEARREREEILRLIRLLNDAKTCLRYMLLLLGDGRERLLQQYVDQVKESLAEGNVCE